MMYHFTLRSARATQLSSKTMRKMERKNNPTHDLCPDVQFPVLCTDVYLVNMSIPSASAFVSHSMRTSLKTSRRFWIDTWDLMPVEKDSYICYTTHPAINKSVFGSYAVILSGRVGHVVVATARG